MILDDPLLEAHLTAIFELCEAAEEFASHVDAQLEELVDAPVRGSRKEALYAALEEIPDPAGRDAFLDALIAKSVVATGPAARRAKDDESLTLQYVVSEAARRVVETQDALHRKIKISLCDTPERKQ